MESPAAPAAGRPVIGPPRCSTNLTSKSSSNKHGSPATSKSIASNMAAIRQLSGTSKAPRSSTRLPASRSSIGSLMPATGSIPSERTARTMEANLMVAIREKIWIGAGEFHRERGNARSPVTWLKLIVLGVSPSANEARGHSAEAPYFRERRAPARRGEGIADVESHSPSWGLAFPGNFAVPCASATRRGF